MKPLSYPVRYKSARDFLADWERSLAKGAVFVDTMEPEPAGSTVNVSLHLPSSAGTMSIVGQVAFAVTPGPGVTRPGMGVRFTLEAAAASALESFVRKLSSGKSSAPVLVVDDDKLILAQVSDMLEAEGFQVTTALDAPTALGLLEERKFEAILSDIHMPKMDGFEFRNVLMMDRKTGSIPFIVITSSADDASRAIAKKLGAQALLPKPIAIDPLLSVLRRAVAGPAAARGDRTDPEIDIRGVDFGKAPADEEVSVEIDADVLALAATSPPPETQGYRIVCSTCGQPYELDSISDERLLRSCPSCLRAGNA